MKRHALVATCISTVHAFSSPGWGGANRLGKQQVHLCKAPFRALSPRDCGGNPSPPAQMTR
eukprot:9516892-Prorocentrum_lima.AAC.1